MALKIYRKGNVLVCDDGTESLRINGTFSAYSLDTLNEVVTINELGNEHKTISAYSVDCQDNKGNGFENFEALDNYLSVNTNFSGLLGGETATPIEGGFTAR